MKTKAEMAAYKRQWYEAHRAEAIANSRRHATKDPAKTKAQKAAWYQRTIEKQRAKHAVRYQKHKDVVVGRAKNWAAANPDRVKDAKLRLSFGISLEQYNAMLDAQGGVCAICHRPETTPVAKGSTKLRALAVDHCHDTGKVRGLLCAACNQSLGKMDESADRLRTAAAYLDQYK